MWQPRVNKNWLGSYTHSLGSNLHNDFRVGYHRMDVDTLNYFWVNGIEGAGSALGIPGFDADVAFENHGIPNFGISAFSGLGQGGRTGTSTTPRSSSRTCSPIRAGRTTFARGSMPAGWQRGGSRVTNLAASSISPATCRATPWRTSCSACRGAS